MGQPYEAEQLGAPQSRLGDVTTMVPRTKATDVGPNERIGPSVATAHFLYLLRREVRHLSGRSKD